MLSVLDILEIGPGPSSSHSVGPMRIGKRFVDAIRARGQLDKVHRITVDLNGSLGATGLVQIPCIERNAMGAVKAVNAARLALPAAHTHKVQLDQVIETMRKTGLDMSRKYKKSEGGLAVNVIEC